MTDKVIPFAPYANILRAIFDYDTNIAHPTIKMSNLYFYVPDGPIAFTKIDNLRIRNRGKRSINAETIDLQVSKCTIKLTDHEVSSLFKDKFVQRLLSACR